MAHPWSHPLWQKIEVRLYRMTARGLLLWVKRELRVSMWTGQILPKNDPFLYLSSRGFQGAKYSSHPWELEWGCLLLWHATSPLFTGCQPLWHFSVGDSSKESLWEMPASTPPHPSGGQTGVCSCQQLQGTPRVSHCIAWNEISFTMQFMVQETKIIFNEQNLLCLIMVNVKVESKCFA
jgi:hypothetical protein